MGQQDNTATPSPNQLARLQQMRLREPYESLRKGHGLLSPAQFYEAMRTDAIRVLDLPHDCYALYAVGESEEGRVLNILTTTGDATHGDAGLAAIEYEARRIGAKLVMSVGRPGWTGLARAHGYDVTPCVLMRKKL